MYNTTLKSFFLLEAFKNEIEAKKVPLKKRNVLLKSFDKTPRSVFYEQVIKMLIISFSFLFYSLPTKIKENCVYLNAK